MIPFLVGSQASEMVVAGTSMRVYRHLMSPLAVGDYMLMQVDPAAAPVVNIPAGWGGQYFATANGTIVKQSTFWKVVTQADLTTEFYTVTFGVSSTARATIHVFRGVDTTDPANFPRSSTSGTGTAPTSLTVTTPCPNCVLVHMVATINNTNITPPSTFTEMQDSGALLGANTVRGQSSYKLIAAEGNTGTFAASTSVSAGWVVTVVALPCIDYTIFRSASTASNTVATTPNVVVTKPTGAAAGDTLLVGVKIDSTTATIRPPATFILESDTVSGTFRFQVYRKILSAVEPTGYEWRRDPAGYIAVHMLCYRGGLTTGESLGATTAVATPSSTTHATSLTTQRNDSRLIAFFAEAGNNAGTTLVTPPSGMTERTDVQLIEGSDVLQLTAGASGTKTATFTVTAVGVASLLELKARYLSAAPAMDASVFWGSPEIYTPVLTPMDPELFWGAPEMYFSASGGPQTVVVPEATVSLTAITPTVSLGAVSLSVPVVTVSSAAIIPAVSLGAVSLTVPVVSVGAEAISPTILAPILLSVPVVTVTSGAVPPDVILGAVLSTVPEVTITTTAHAPVISLGAVNLSVPVASVGTEAESPTVTLGPVERAVPEATIAVGAVSPDVVLGAVNLEVPVVTVSVGVTAPMTGDAQSIPVPPITVSVEAEAPIASLVTPPPVVSSGGYQPRFIHFQTFRRPISVTVPSVSVSAKAIAPTVTLGTRAVKAQHSQLFTRAIPPVVRLGRVTVQPLPVELRTEVVAPQIRLGGVSVVPDAIQVTSEVFAPEAYVSELIELGDISLYVHRDLSLSFMVPKGVSIDVLVSNGQESQTVEVPF